jgi:hypothetical protein
LEYDPGRDHIAGRDELLTLFHEKLDFLRIKHANGLARGWRLSASRARLPYCHNLAKVISDWGREDARDQDDERSA